jgi:hypothetical protein
MSENKKLFAEWLQTNYDVYHFSESLGVFTIGVKSNVKSFLNQFNRWNEQNGINFSIVSLPQNVYIVY